MECPKARVVTGYEGVAGQSGGDTSQVKLKIFLRTGFQRNYGYEFNNRYSCIRGRKYKRRLEDRKSKTQRKDQKANVLPGSQWIWVLVSD